MSQPISSEYSLEGLAAIRNEPVQARSTARLAALLDAAAAAVDELGFERLTTAMVAERAGASIGTVYRYFPDRIAVLHALAARNFDRVSDRLRVELSNEAHSSWPEAMDGAFDVLVSAFRDESGFRSLRVGDVIDLRPRPASQTYNSRLAGVLLSVLESRFGLEVTDDARVAFESAVEVADALLARAFAHDDNGDPAFLDHGRALVHHLMQQHFGGAAQQ